jgi:geranylgeranyl pyrophosphate synthase
MSVGRALGEAAAKGERTERDLAAVEALMRRGGPRLLARMRRAEDHLEQATAEVGAPLAGYVAAGGKRVRPLLVLLAAEAEPIAGGIARERALTRAAVAVELMHSATLAHDDVLDGARLRRGQPTVVALAGPRAAIATGDLLFARAFAELARNDDIVQLRTLSDAALALSVGELLQREDLFAGDVSVDRYLERCELKTAALFEVACRLGARVVEGSRRAGHTANGPDPWSANGQSAAVADGRAARIDGDGARPRARGSADGLPAAFGFADVIGCFARRIGLAFQLVDDVLDVTGSVAHTGKWRGTDLLDGTVTLPLILARQRDPELASLDLRALRGPRQAEVVCDRIAASGALEEARKWALQIVWQAKSELPSTLPAHLAGLLDLVADAVVERYR